MAAADVAAAMAAVDVAAAMAAADVAAAMAAADVVVAMAVSVVVVVVVAMSLVPKEEAVQAEAVAACHGALYMLVCARHRSLYGKLTTDPIPLYGGADHSYRFSHV